MSNDTPNTESRTLQKLAWLKLLNILSSYCQTDEAHEKSLHLAPTMAQDEVLKRWDLVLPLKELSRNGYRAPIGNLTPLSAVFRSADLGQILEGTELRDILSLLSSVERVHAFIDDFSDRCPTLARIGRRIYPLPNLTKAISRAIDPDGSLLDDASPELTEIRRSKLSLRKKIELQIQTMMSGNEFGPYLQDDFFTTRSDRYVVPIRLDGRGRIKGSIIDTSVSGQTLYIEPSSISPLNEEIQELELAEKLEIIKIFRTLSSSVRSELDILKTNYTELIDLDFLCAQADLSWHLRAGKVGISTTPGIDLREARHPLIRRPNGETAIPNDINVLEPYKSLVISGPNAGGKTVILETLGILHLMLKAGLLIPAHPESTMYFFGKIFIEMGDAQDLMANLSTFSGHLFGLKTILDKASEKDLVLLDELAVGTEPETGSAIAQAVLESLCDQGSISVSTTHYDSLKGLAVHNKNFRNGSMEYSVSGLTPTYKLLLDIPGQSYGLEVAKTMGISPKIIARAKDLRGHTASSLDMAVSQLAHARDEVTKSQDSLRREIHLAELEKLKWQTETKKTLETRREIGKNLSQKYDDELRSFKVQFDGLSKEIRKTNKTIASADPQLASSDNGRHRSNLKRSIEATLKNYDQKLGALSQEFALEVDLPGTPATLASIAENTKIYLTSLKKSGVVTKKPSNVNDSIEIEIGNMKIRVALNELRVYPPQQSPNKKKNAARKNIENLKNFAISAKTAKTAKYAKTDKKKLHAPNEMVIPSPRNTCDLRGLDLDDALTKAWNYIDAAVLRGENAVVMIHGHGTDRLKTGLRTALDLDSPYALSFRAGSDQEGGNGVTVVYLAP